MKHTVNGGAPGVSALSSIKQSCPMGLSLASLVALAVLALAAAPPLVAQATRRAVALTNARIETVTRGTIERGTLVMRDGRIVALGPDVAVPSDAETIDCAGLTLYPGMIDGGTSLGLVEVGSLAETRDNDELGSITPYAQALTAINPNAVAIPVTRVNGVTAAFVAPGGGLFPGTGALVELLGYTPEQMSVAGMRAVVLDFPSSGRRAWWDQRTEEKINEDNRRAMRTLNELWDRASLFSRADSARRAAGGTLDGEYAPELEAIAPVVRGEMPLMIEVDAARDIDSALAWIRRRGIRRPILAGVAEGWRVAGHIAAADVPCVVGPVLANPTRGSDRYDKGYANPALIARAGVQVALRTTENANVRNLPYHAGFAAAYGARYGFDREAALRAVTINPARIFGVDSVLGSLEVGKRATLFAADGDPFEPATNIRRLFIDGYDVPLDSRHTELYREFIQRSPGVAK